MIPTISNGIDQLAQVHAVLQGKRIGLLTSQTGMDARMRSTVDIIHEKYNLTALFSPEHGVRGDQEAGALIDTYTDPATGVPVYSLYRKDSKRIADEMLDDVDVVVYDIQDIGTRYYTYIYSMIYMIEDCARLGRELVILDRINPLDGVTVEGNILKDGFKSFVGNYPLAVRYGLTCGEVAQMANDQMNYGCKLHVAKLHNWDRRMQFPDTGKVWIQTSVNIPRFDTALLYPGTCLFEGTNISEGRGTTFPFEMIGAPFLDAEKLAFVMNSKQLAGVHFRPAYFRPSFSKHAGELCRGVQLHILDRKAIQSVHIGLELLFAVKEQTEEFSFLPPIKEGSRPFIDLLTGDSIIRQHSGSAKELHEQFMAESEQFASMKQEYHLYN